MKNCLKTCYGWRSESPNGPKLSDGGGWRDGCAGAGGGAASVTAGAVRCSAWLGDLVLMENLDVQCLLCFVEHKLLDGKVLRAMMEHLLRNGNGESIRMLTSWTVANPCSALDIHTTLRVGGFLW